MDGVGKLIMFLVVVLIGIVLITTVSMQLWKGIGADPAQSNKAAGLNKTVQDGMNGLVPPK